MADLGTMTSGPDVSTGDGGPDRRVRRRRSLPGGRAVAGAFLVTAAAVGVFAAYLNATAAPGTAYVVATTAIAPGETVEAGALATVAMDVPATQADQLVPASDLDEVTGRVALGPVRQGDLLQWTSVLGTERPDGASSFTFSIPSSRVAFRGDLAAGDTVDLVATYGDTTVYVARAIPLLTRPVPGDSGTSITVAIQDPSEVLAIANALDAAQVFAVRSDPDADTSTPPTPFRPGDDATSPRTSTGTAPTGNGSAANGSTGNTSAGNGS